MSLKILCDLSNIELVVVDRMSHESNFARVEETAKENGLSISELSTFDITYKYKVEFGEIVQVETSSGRKAVAREEAFNIIFRFLCEKFPRIVVTHPFSSTRVTTYNHKEDFEDWAISLCEDLCEEPFIDNMIVTTPLTKEQRQLLHFHATRYGLRTRSYNSQSGERLISLSHVSNIWRVYFYLKKGGASYRYRLVEAE